MSEALSAITKIVTDNTPAFIGIVVASVGITFIGKLIRRAFK